MKSIFLVLTILVIAGLLILTRLQLHSEKNQPIVTSSEAVNVTPINHATMMLQWENTVMYTDPVGDVSLFDGLHTPDIVILTDIHGDHLSLETLTGVVATDTVIIAPQAVATMLSPELLKQTVVLNNGEQTRQQGISIEAIPMYNLPESSKSFHTKGRGNGYVLEKNGFRVYIAGDTSGIPEMRALQSINMAFIPMNLPYTMSVDEAVDAVLVFAPRRVYPYHYRGQDGLSDVERFKALVESKNPNIEVVLLNWYPNN